MEITLQIGLSEHPAKLASILSGMTDEEINATPPDDFAHALIAQMETKELLLTCEDMDEIEAICESQGATIGPRWCYSRSLGHG